MEKRKRSSMEEMKKKEKVYVFLSHDENTMYHLSYSLYALDIPSPGTIVKANTTVVTTTTETTVNGELVNTTRKITSSSTEPERSRVSPILRFRKDDWPNNMSCIRMDSKLYFLGGGYTNSAEWSREVYVLDLSEQEIPYSKRDEPRKVLKRVASMNSGKSKTLVSFVADGKMYVVSSFNKSKNHQFEIFDPSSEGGEWKIPEQPPPPFKACYLSHLVIGRTVFFFGAIPGIGNDFIICYDIDSGTWSECHIDCFGYIHEDLMLTASGGEVIGETLWNVCDHPERRLHVAVRLDISMMKTETEKKKKKKKFFEVIRYHIGNSRRRGVLTRLDSRRRRRFCVVEVKCVDYSCGGERFMISVTLFDVSRDGDSAEYLTSAHYYTKYNPGASPDFDIEAAHVV